MRALLSEKSQDVRVTHTEFILREPMVVQGQPMLRCFSRGESGGLGNTSTDDECRDFSTNSSCCKSLFLSIDFSMCDFFVHTLHVCVSVLMFVCAGTQAKNTSCAPSAADPEAALEIN